MFKLTTLQKGTIIAMVAFGIVAAIWMMSGGPGMPSKSPATKSLLNAKALCVACRTYALEHEGKFPPSLDALFPTYLKDRSMLASPLKPDEPVGYIYTPGLTDKGPVNTVVIEDKFAPAQHIRIVAYVDDSARILTTP
jgi:hypothetical protein